MNTEGDLYKSTSSSTTVFDRIIRYIDKKYKIRYNEISLEFEIKTEKTDWTELNLNSLYIELIQAGINITLGKLEILMRSHLILRYNPLQEYFDCFLKMDLYSALHLHFVNLNLIPR